ncbi:MAG: phosphatidic acid phosphatase [Oscillospiraceae bacterium]|nr:phosphatidic acid phosphatase [Oscillospiraceae bacterium]
MRTPMVDYRQFRFRKLNSPEFSHLKLLLTWLIYFSLYFITENLIPVEKCTPIHIFLDDLIPFCEWFIIPYVFWYGLIVFSLGYFLLYDVDSFRRLQIYIFTTQMLAMTVYILFPSRQDLRPEVFPRDNVLTGIIGFLYSFDTNTGVLPSLHVAYSLGIMSTWLRRKATPLWGSVFVVTAVVLICLSTMFIKQHSAADFFAALPVCLVAEAISHRRVTKHPYPVRTGQ